MSLDGTFSQSLSSILIFVLSFVLVKILAQKFKIPQSIATILFLWHSSFAVAYWRYTLSNPADAVRYFKDAFDVLPAFGPGTAFINYVVTPLVQVFDISYFGLYLIFHVPGLIGIFGIYATLRTITAGSRRSTYLAGLGIALLPGLNFWSVAPGKDSLSLMAVGLTVWAFSTVNIRKGVVFFSITMMFLIRPHVAAVFIFSIFFANLTTSQLVLLKKILVIAITAPLCFLAIQYTLFFVGTELSDIGSYVEKRQSYNQRGGGAISLETMSIPAKMFAYLFRPFFESFGIGMLLITFEHILLLYVLGRGVMHRITVKSLLPVFSRRMFLICSLILWVMFAFTTANLGIALRQKWMLLPMLLVLAMSYWPRKAR